MPSSQKRVAIIGAGPCGLAALKEMLAGGHEATAFERASQFGGVFASDIIYPDVYLTLSNWSMAYSDFPANAHQHYPSAREYLLYLQDYAKHFDLERHIKCDTEVISAKLTREGNWRLEVRNSGAIHVEHANALIVATGANQLAKSLPEQLSGFTGRVIHSSEYNNVFKEEATKKELRILVVGGGESGADIAAELGEATPHTAVWLRRPNCVGPRFLVPDPELPQVVASKHQRFPVNGFLEAATTNRMSAAQNVFTYGILRRLLWNLPILNKQLSKTCLDSTASAWLMNDQATYVTKNQRMCEAWGNGTIEVFITPEVYARDKVVEFGKTATTQAETRDFDVLVLCTGYVSNFPWLKLDQGSFDPNPRSWYLHCFPQYNGHRLFFIGYARPHQGGIPAMSEMQSRYISLILRGDRHLPSDYADRASRNRASELEYYSISPGLNTLVDYNAFLESIARRVGCEPRLPVTCVLAVNAHLLGVAFIGFCTMAPNRCPVDFTTALFLWIMTLISFFKLSDGLILKWWFYPHWSHWYRQRGPGADAKMVEVVLGRTDIWRDTKITRGFILLVLWSWLAYYAQKALSVMCFIPYVIANVLGMRYAKSWGGFLAPKIFVLHDCEWRLSDLFLP